MANLLGVLLGVAVFCGGAYEVMTRLRLQKRMLRATGVFVGWDDVLSPGGPSTTSRAARFRFTTAQGRPFETTSSLSSYPGPQLGTSMTVIYDPADPEDTAERLVVHYLQMFTVGPLLMAVGVAVVAVNAVAL